MYNKIILFLLSLFASKEGLHRDTPIATQNGNVPICQLKEDDKVLSYDFEQKKIVESKINKIQRFTRDSYYLINGLACTEKQLIFLHAYWLQANEFNDCKLINCPCEFYCLTIDQTHNFYATEKRILVHNEPITIVVGSILGWECVVKIGIPALIAGAVWVGKCVFGSDRPTNKEIALGTICGGVANKYYADKAPGKPGINDGYVPPKKGNGRKVKHEDSGQYGWLDDQGRIWIPTGPKGHGGPHWDRQYPNGGYDNVLPGGKVRSGTR